jgi:arylsulfatase A-like enzyme
MVRFLVWPSLIAVIGVVLYYHPGAKYSYFTYLPGIITHFFEETTENHPVLWARQEIPRTIALGDTKVEARPPNVIIIVADDLGYNDLSGGVGAQTPNIDALRDSGVQFTQAYAAHATCSPARAGLLTGRIPNRFGYESLAVPVSLSFTVSVPSEGTVRHPVFHYELMGKVPDIADMIIPHTEVMISDVLRNASNYSTVYIGKWHLGKRNGMKPENHFNEVLGFLGGASMYMFPAENNPGVVNGYLDDPLDRYLWANLDDFVQHNGTARFPPKDYMTDYLAKRAADAIRTKLKVPSSPHHTVPPLFMVVAFNAPHTPLQAKKEDFDSPEFAHITNHNERVYAAMIKSLDRGVGHIMKAIRDVGEQENTIVVFTSDNGGPGYVGIQDMNKPLRGWKATFFEGGIRVHFLMAWPTHLPAQYVYDRPVSHCDIFATVAAVARADLSGLREDRVIDGVNLLPYLLPSSSFSGQETAVAASSSPHDSLFWRTGTYCAHRYHNWKMQVSYRPDNVWFYDIESDIGEKYTLVKGLRWSDLRQALDNAAEDASTCTSEILALRQNSSVVVADDMIQIVCEVGRSLLDANNQLVEPLWPSLTEVPMPVDAADAGVRTLEEEYVYWFL